MIVPPEILTVFIDTRFPVPKLEPVISPEFTMSSVPPVIVKVPLVKEILLAIGWLLLDGTDPEFVIVSWDPELIVVFPLGKKKFPVPSPEIS